jgi:glutathione peroxidase
MPTLHDFSARRLLGEVEPLAVYRGKVVLLVNVASACGLTPQYAGLERLWRELGPRGLVVLGFPCNQFAGQEPGSESEIAAFCAGQYEVSFPLFSKIEVNGAGADPLYKWVKAALPGVLGTKAVKWNFTKFLIDAEGRPVRRYGPEVEPAALASDIEALLLQQGDGQSGLGG